ncbi:MAG: hypothetical protein AB1394_07900 [Bacteroidota bacterium]
MKKLIVITMLLITNLLAQGVDYNKQQAKRLPVEATIMIDHDTLSNAQMDNLRETLKTLSEKYHLDARLVIRRYDKNYSLESYNYKAKEKPFYLIFDTVYEDYSAKKAWVKDVKRAIKYTREEAIVELNRMFKKGNQEYSTSRFEDYPIIVIPVFSKQ